MNVFPPSLPSYFCNNNSLLEQHTEVQQDAEFVTGETSVFDATDLESALKITPQSKPSIPLSLVNGTKEVTLQESVPVEVTLDTIVEEDRSIELKSDSKEAKPTLNIHGQFKNCFKRIYLSKKCFTSCVAFFLLVQSLLINI